MYPLFFFCFIDYIKTFDTVQHNQNWRIVREMAVPHHLIYVIQCASTVYASVNNDLSRRFQVGRGAIQGRILSPLLFNVYMENS